VPLPVAPEGCRTLGTGYQDYRILGDKSLEILAQLRHMPLAKGSGKAAVEHQHDMLAAPEI
jgi:hypothetical protein